MNGQHAKDCQSKDSAIVWDQHEVLSVNHAREMGECQDCGQTFSREIEAYNDEHDPDLFPNVEYVVLHEGKLERWYQDGDDDPYTADETFENMEAVPSYYREPTEEEKSWFTQEDGELVAIMFISQHDIDFNNKFFWNGQQ